MLQVELRGAYAHRPPPSLPRQAATLPGDKRVVLAAHAYPLTAPLTVPNHTVITGAAATSSSLVFSLPSTGASTPAVSGSGSHWGLRYLSLVLLSAAAKTPAVAMLPGTTNFSAVGVNVTMQQLNVSNAFRIEGSVFEIAHSFIWQSGVCLWPPQDDSTDFPSSVTLHLHGADSGHIHHNTLLWQCSAYDMDCSSRVLFEDNTVTCTQAGVIPHG
jgi:hypothetical protein